MTVAMAGLAPAAATSSPHPDARLIDLCQQYLALEDASDRLDDEEWPEAELRDIVSKMHDVLGELMEMPAATAQGLRMKAQVAMRRVQMDSNGNCLTNEDHVSWSIANDILLMTGGAP